MLAQGAQHRAVNIDAAGKHLLSAMLKVIRADGSLGALRMDSLEAQGMCAAAFSALAKLAARTPAHVRWTQPMNRSLRPPDYKQPLPAERKRA